MKTNDLVALFHYARIKQIISPHKVQVTDLENGMDFYIDGKELVERLINSTYVEEERKAPKTEVAHILETVGHQPVTVCFVKQDGTERIMRCKRIGDGHFGRSQVFDFESKGVRLVDHRTLKWLIVDGTKHIVK